MWFSFLRIWNIFWTRQAFQQDSTVVASRGPRPERSKPSCGSWTHPAWVEQWLASPWDQGESGAGRISSLHFIPLPRQTHPMHPPGCSVPVWKSGISSGLSWWCIFWAMVMVRKLRRRPVNIIFTLFLGGSDKVNHLNALLYPGCSEQSADQRISVI